MQGLTRNPLADPGILGVNAGAALFVVIGIYWFGITSLLGYVWFAFAGAAVASVVVYALGSLGREGATPVKLALAGAAAHRPARLDHHGHPADRRRHARPVPLLGRRLARRADADDRRQRGAVHRRRPACWRSPAGPLLNALALGDDVARGLGQRIGLSRLARRGRASCCCAARRPRRPGRSRSSASPSRTSPGPSPGPTTAGSSRTRWCWRRSSCSAPTSSAASIARPGEVQVGIVTAVIGAPVFIVLVRRRKLAEL